MKRGSSSGSSWQKLKSPSLLYFRSWKADFKVQEWTWSIFNIRKKTIKLTADTDTIRPDPTITNPFNSLPFFLFPRGPSIAEFFHEPALWVHEPPPACSQHPPPGVRHPEHSGPVRLGAFWHHHLGNSRPQRLHSDRQGQDCGTLRGRKVCHYILIAW